MVTVIYMIYVLQGRYQGGWMLVYNETQNIQLKRISSQKIQQSEGRARGLKIFSLFRVKKRGAWGILPPSATGEGKISSVTLIVGSGSDFSFRGQVQRAWRYGKAVHRRAWVSTLRKIGSLTVKKYPYSKFVPTPPHISLLNLLLL